MRKVLFAAILLMGATGAAYAQLPDAYVGAGVSQARISDIFHSGHDFDLNNTAWKAFVGVRPIPFLGVEANYMDLGSESRSFGFTGFQSTNGHVNAHAFSAFAVGFFPLPVPWLDVYGKAGAARWTLNGHDSSSLFDLDEQGTDFAWGGGGQAHFGPFGLRLEYEQFNVRNTNGVKAASFDVLYHFL